MTHDDQRYENHPRGTGTPTPDPEVAVKSGRRRFTAESRLRILEEAERRMKPGEVGQLLRREGLYSSHLASWRKARHDGALRGLTLKTRGAKPKAINPLEPKVRELESKVARLEKELHKAHTILDVQEEVAGLLGDSTSRAERTRERGLRIGAED